MGQLAVFRELGGVEIHIAVNLVRESLVHEGLYDVDDDVHVLSYLRVYVGAADVQPVGVDEVLLYRVLGYFVRGLAEFVCLLDDLVVNVGEVLYIEHLVSAEFEVAAQGVEYAQRPGVSYVDKVVDGRTAGIDLHSARCNGLELFLLPRHSVVDLHFIFLLVLCFQIQPAYFSGRLSASACIPSYKCVRRGAAKQGPECVSGQGRSRSRGRRRS